MTELALNRKQLGKLAEIYEHFKEVEWFTIKEDHSSGIGAGLVVTFNLFATNREIEFLSSRNLGSAWNGLSPRLPSIVVLNTDKAFLA